MIDRIVVILGPTAGGKSELAVALARRFGGEILGADSMQVYRHLDAGTAKPEPELRAAAVHHLIDIVEPTERFSVADWLTRAEALIAGLHRRGRLPIVVGGTNLYLKALLEGLFEGPPADAGFRASLEGMPGEELHRRLAAVDPATAARIHPADRKRIVRALEVHHATGRPLSELQTQWDRTSPDRQGGGSAATQGREPRTGTGTDPRNESARPRGVPEPPPLRSGFVEPYRHAPILLGLHWPVEAINRRINARVKAMFEPPEGLVEETRRLESAGLLGEQAREALGTKQVLNHLAGRCTRDEALERTKIETRRYAKNQRTWLKRYRGVHWLDMATLTADQAAAEAMRVVELEVQIPRPEGGAI